MNRQTLQQIARENLGLIETGAFLPDADEAAARQAAKACGKVIVVTPAETAANREAFLHNPVARCQKPCLRVIREDSFEALRVLPHGTRALVLNFANAYHPGGEYLYGAIAQEETLCRRSTLYASLSSPAAEEMYRYNEEHLSPEGSDYLLLSPYVTIFRDMRYRLTPRVTTTAVISAPALDLDGEAGMLPQAQIDQVMQRRVENLLLAAAAHGYPSIILGAWGCGAFRHDAKTVAGYFQQALIENKLAYQFENVVFSVYSPLGNYNFNAFYDAIIGKEPRDPAHVRTL